MPIHNKLIDNCITRTSLSHLNPCKMHSLKTYLTLLLATATLTYALALPKSNPSRPHYPTLNARNVTNPSIYVCQNLYVVAPPAPFPLPNYLLTFSATGLPPASSSPSAPRRTLNKTSGWHPRPEAPAPSAQATTRLGVGARVKA